MTDPTPDPTPTRDEAVPVRPRIEPLLKDGDVVDRLKQFRLRWQDSGDLTYLGKALVDAIVEIAASRKALDAPALAERIMHRLFPQGSTADRHITTGYAWERLQKDIAKALEAEATPALSSAKRWPFIESPGDFAMRLEAAFFAFDSDMLAAVRNCLIENPPMLASAAAPASGGVDAVAETERVLRASEELLVKTFGDPSDDPLTNKTAERLIARIRRLTGGEHV